MTPAEAVAPETDLHVDSVAVRAGRADLPELGVHAPPLDLSSTYPLPDIDRGGDSYEALASGGRPLTDGGPVYARLWNPTVARMEAGVADLEHAEAAVAFSSGMAALTAVVLSVVADRSRRHVVAVRPLYGGTDHLLANGLLGLQTTFCHPHEVGDAIRDDTALVVAETPANPTLEVLDIAALVRAARSVPVLVDNTFATPVLQNPLDWGATFALHSATKYLGGHGDVVAGVVATDESQAGGLRRVRAITGAILHPLGAYLVHRGLPTLPLRVRAQQRTARLVAYWLTDRPEVAHVHYPEFDRRAGLLDQQMRGPGAMIAAELTGGREAAVRLTSALRVFEHAVSLGGVGSLVEHPAALTHRPVSDSARPPGGLVRFSIGLEHPEDLIGDLDRGLTAARG